MRVILFFGAMLGWAFCPVAAQVVQLPEMHQFSASTTVSVPDYGGAYLGGVNRAAQGSASRGWGPITGSRGIGSAMAASSISVHATIINHEELDARLLAEAAKHKGHPPSESLVLKKTTESSASKGSASLNAIRAELAAFDAQQEQAAEFVFQKALAAEENKEWRLARAYYQLAMQKSPKLVKEKSQQRLQALEHRSP